jgi:hypothetical protein
LVEETLEKATQLLDSCCIILEPLEGAIKGLLVQQITHNRVRRQRRRPGKTTLGGGAWCRRWRGGWLRNGWCTGHPAQFGEATRKYEDRSCGDTKYLLKAAVGDPYLCRPSVAKESRRGLWKCGQGKYPICIRSTSHIAFEDNSCGSRIGIIQEHGSAKIVFAAWVQSRCRSAIFFFAGRFARRKGR